MTDPQPIVEQIHRSFDLKDFNSLALPAKAEFFCSIDTVSQLQQALAYANQQNLKVTPCLLYTSPSPRDRSLSRMPSSA